MKKSLGAETIAMPTPVWLVGTYDQDGKANIATIAWGGICCSEPPAVAVSFRKSRYTYDAIVQRQAFTVSIPSQEYLKAADYAGMASGRNADKFQVAGLTAVRSELVDAPYVSECPLVLECRLIQTVEIGIHVQFIGEIVDVKADESVLNPNGQVDGSKLLPVVFNPSDRNYFGIGAVLGKGFDIGRELLGK